MEHVFERQSLFEEVWSKPLTFLAKKYGLSDNGLRKICKAMDIPLPVAGHWSKAAVGKAGPRPDLPPDARRTRFVSDPPNVGGNLTPFSSKEDEEWLTSRASEERERPAIDATSRTSWHPAIRPLRDSLREIASRYERALLLKSRTPRGSKHFPRTDYSYLDLHNNEYILGGMNRALAIRASSAGLERALMVANSILVEAVKRDFEVSLDIAAGRFVLRMMDTSVTFYVSEQIERSPGSTKLQANSTAGKMRLIIDSSIRSKTIAEADSGQFSIQVRRFFLCAFSFVVKSRADGRKWQADRLALERDRQQREAQQAALEREKAAAQADLERRALLSHQADQWEQACRIRALVRHLETEVRSGGAANQVPNPRFSEWSSWALKVASDLDPTARLLGRSQKADDMDVC